tara:strand:- start:837 stop:1199 length:363 start_codon:yes stop_codon:yes gene_type:complete
MSLEKEVQVTLTVGEILVIRTLTGNVLGNDYFRDCTDKLYRKSGTAILEISGCSKKIPFVEDSPRIKSRDWVKGMDILSDFIEGSCSKRKELDLRKKALKEEQETLRLKWVNYRNDVEKL